MHPTRSMILKIVIILLSIFIVSAGIELLYFNYHAIRYGGELDLTAQELLPTATGFELQGDKLVPTTENAALSYTFPDNYYSKLTIEYESTDDSTYSIFFGSFDSAGNDQSVPTADVYSHQFNKAVTYIGLHAHSLYLVFPTQGIAINHIYLQNQVDFNVLRYTFMCITGLLFVFIIFSKKIIGEKIELAFLIIALTVGVLMIILIPLRNPVTWDDDTHFHRIYEQSFYSRDVIWTQSAYDYRYFQVPVANTIEEKAAVVNYLDGENDFTKPVVTGTKSLYIPYTFRCYIPQSSAMALSRSMNLSFTATESLSRFAGLLFYCLIIYAAISMAKFGKRIIAVVALMPTPLFMASNFCYDPFVISLAILAFTAFTTEYFDREHKMNLKTTAIFLASIIFAACTKAVYIPLILVALLLPEAKFQSKKNMRLFQLGIIAIFLAIMATFVLPTIINPSSTGDLRGGNTSISGQLSFIIHDPVFFVRLLAKCLWETFGSYFFGSLSYVNLAYLGLSTNNCSYLSIGVILFAVFTDAVRDDKYSFKPSSKIYILAVIFSVMCLVWIALYLSFTPVGANAINGVQSRYYLPLAIPLLFMMRSTKIETKISPIVLNRIIFAVCTFILLFTTYDFILKPYNF